MFFLIFFFVFALIAGGLVAMGIYCAFGGGKPEEPPEPNREPGPFKTSLLKIKETFREDDANPTYCSRCNKHMTPLYSYNGKPANQYQCMSCKRTITITVSS